MRWDLAFSPGAVLRSAETHSLERGAKLTLAGSAAGEIVSAAFSPALGKVVAMAYVRTPHSEPGTELVLGDAVARQPALLCGDGAS